jgi:hypothetical protein
MSVEQDVLNILYSELNVAIYDEYSASIEGREEAAKRIMDEIIIPILSQYKAK